MKPNLSLMPRLPRAKPICPNAFLPMMIVGWLASAPLCHAMVYWNLDNTANTTDPSTGAPWMSVGMVTNASGTTRNGSVVYLGNGYVLTANHVGMDSTNSKISFDGTKQYTVDTTFKSGIRYSGKQVESGISGTTLDLAVVKLTTVPIDIPAVSLLTTSIETTSSATLIGWGVGRAAGEALLDPVVTWGGVNSAVKRWGENRPYTIYNANYDGYNFTSILTIAGANGTAYYPDGLGNAEASPTQYDSGGGLFQNIGGTWYLIGITNAISQMAGAGTTTFGNDALPTGFGDYALYTQISSYSSQILATIPEPSAGIGAMFAGILLLKRRRNVG